MTKLRKCGSANLNTGLSKCEPDFEKVLGSILVPHGVKLPEELTPEKLEELAHADRPGRIYGIAQYVEYAKNGGETQVAAQGYGSEKATGVSAWRDTFTMEQYYASLVSSLTKTMNTQFDVYHFDDNKILFGLSDGTGVLAGIPCSTVYADGTPHKTSGSVSTMTVNFSYKNARRIYEDFDYIELDFRPEDLVIALTPVVLKKEGEGYKIYEAVGKNDLTSEYGALIQTAGKDVFVGTVTAVTYDASKDIIIVTGGSDDLKLQSPSELFKAGIKGIEQI